jgi:hypothetical protein
VQSSQEEDPLLIPSRMPIGKPPTEVGKPAALPAGPTPDRPKGPIYRPQTTVTVAQFLPRGIKDAGGWASDMTEAFNALKLPLTQQNICAKEGGFIPDSPDEAPL